MHRTFANGPAGQDIGSKRCHRRPLRQPQADIVVGTFHVPSTNINQVCIELSRMAQRARISVASDAPSDARSYRNIIAFYRVQGASPLHPSISRPRPVFGTARSRGIRPLATSCAYDRLSLSFTCPPPATGGFRYEWVIRVSIKDKNLFAHCSLSAIGSIAMLGRESRRFAPAFDFVRS